MEARRFEPASERASVPVGNSNRASAVLPGGFPLHGMPAQSAGDHEVDHDEAFALERQDDALAEPPEFRHPRAGDVRRRRGHGAERERVADDEPHERLGQNARGEALEVNRDVGELWHGRSSALVIPRGARDRVGPGPRSRPRSPARRPGLAPPPADVRSRDHLVPGAEDQCVEEPCRWNLRQRRRAEVDRHHVGPAASGDAAGRQ